MIKDRFYDFIEAKIRRSEKHDFSILEIFIYSIMTILLIISLIVITALFTILSIPQFLYNKFKRK